MKFPYIWVEYWRYTVSDSNSHPIRFRSEEGNIKSA